MASKVYFKFKSAKEFDTVQFDGFFISPADLKKSILATLGDTTDNDLVLEDAQTGEEYDDGGSNIPKNTSVIVRRVPQVRRQAIVAKDAAAGGAVAAAAPSVAAVTRAADDEFGGDVFAGEGGAAAEEDAKLSAMIAGSADTWGAEVSAGRGRGRG
eukprot:CAMPEP_0119162492 /NCGR_PEP_ID=MMETSP1315-20130426/2472_1 /TAXON_ID=676789 /ORGANISM="Prasinoderma singularis, Strain RCC927" /LENGTH=155 /DNA_ID=CAMNT_0007155365 /DNA_START=351 /DNA_END=814 /DNA_ORIENTATION=+